MPGISRRAWLLGAGGVGVGAVGVAAMHWPKLIAAQTAPQKTRLILLGTGGGPRVTKGGRSKSATLILVKGTPYVIDCGEGVAKQLVEAGVQLDSLRNVLITRATDLRCSSVMVCLVIAIVFCFSGLDAHLRRVSSSAGRPEVVGTTSRFPGRSRRSTRYRVRFSGPFSPSMDVCMSWGR